MNNTQDKLPFIRRINVVGGLQQVFWIKQLIFCDNSILIIMVFI